ncbi:MAG: cytochrome c [Chloroflexi bacterium]|nr:cytochrome c [Chloroflexota bacterium]
MKASLSRYEYGLDKKVALGLALTLALLLATGVYWLTEPSRQKGAGDKYKLASAEIFAQTCVFCHGRQGLGYGTVGPSLRTTKLDEEGLKRTISRGVTVMPAWAREEGGTLTPFQVQGLAAFILNWDEELTKVAVARHPIPATPNPPPPDIPPPPYAGMKNPLPWGDKKNIEMGQILFERLCTECHWLVKPMTPPPPPPPDVREAVWAANIEDYAAYYFWRMSEAPLICHWGPGMPAAKNFLPEKQRWQVLDYVRVMGTLGCNRGLY